MCKGIVPYTPAAPTFRCANELANSRTQIRARKRCPRGLGDTAGLRGAGRTPSLHLRPQQEQRVGDGPACAPLSAKNPETGEGKGFAVTKNHAPTRSGKSLGPPFPKPGQGPPLLPPVGAPRSGPGPSPANTPRGRAAKVSPILPWAARLLEQR